MLPFATYLGLSFREIHINLQLDSVSITFYSGISGGYIFIQPNLNLIH